MDALSEDLKRWFREKWVDISRKTASGKHPPCGRKKSSKKKYPKCRPSVRVSSETPETSGEMSQSEKKAAVRQKRTAEATKKRKGKRPIMTSHRKLKEEVLLEKNVPTNKKLYARVKALAKRKFKVYPSAYANAWLVKTYKAKGGGYKSLKEATDMKNNRKEAIDMAMSELMKTKEYAGELLSMMKNAKDVEPWVQGKITIIGDYIGTIKHYLEYRRSKYGNVNEAISDNPVYRAREYDPSSNPTFTKRVDSFTMPLEPATPAEVRGSKIRTRIARYPYKWYDDFRSFFTSRADRLVKLKHTTDWKDKSVKRPGLQLKRKVTKENFDPVLSEAASKKDMACNKPTRSTSAGKKMMVKACEGGKEKIVHFGAKGYGHNYSPAARKSFRARHKCGQSKSKLSAQYWACKKLWAGPKGSKASCPPGRKCKY